MKLTGALCKFTGFPRESVILNLNLFSDLFETSIQSLTKGGDVETVISPTLNVMLVFFIILLL